MGDMLNIHSESENDGSNSSKQLSADKENFVKPEKVKSRWRRNSEMESSEKPTVSPNTSDDNAKQECITGILNNTDENVYNSEYLKPKCFPVYEHLEENMYLFERKRTKRKKEVRRMLCDCSLTKEDQENGLMGCQDDCLNRLLMIECGSRCITGDACSNRRFQKRQYAKAEPFKTERKGYGLKLMEDIPKGSFVIEYVGEVLNMQEFKQRVKQYAREKTPHYYFMALKSDEIIDATNKGNLSRFINHSCDPNCETQKWTVNGELRIGFFAKRDLKSGEELTFDYQLQRYGRQAQKCYCESEKCNGYIGVSNEITVDIDSNKNSKRKKSSEEKKRDVLEDLILEEEIQKLCINGGLRNKDDTLMFARLMVRAEDSHSREKLLDIILGTTEVACLRLFLDYHGLSLLWSWMADLADLNLKTKILKALSLLPVPNKTMLLHSKVLSVVEKWASAVPNTDSENSVDTPYDKETNKKVKSCDTSDSETDATSCIRPPKSYFAFSNSQGDTVLSDCDVSMPNPSNSCERTGEIHAVASDIDELPVTSNNKSASDTNDEESADTNDDESIKSNKSGFEIASLAQSLLGSWKDLKEDFRIPRREVHKQTHDEGTEYCNRVSEASKQNSIPDHHFGKHDEVKHQNSRDRIKENRDLCYSSDKDEKPQEIKVVCNIEDKYKSSHSYQRKFHHHNHHHSASRLSKEEKRELFAIKVQQSDRRRKIRQEKPVYSPHYNGSSDYYRSPKNESADNWGNSADFTSLSNNENYQFSSVESSIPYNPYFFNSTRPPLLPTPPIPPNPVYAAPAQSVENTIAPVFTPNVFIPPPARVPFLGLPPPPMPQQSPAVPPCQNSNMLPSSHIIGMPTINSSSIVPAVSTSVTDQLGTEHIKTQNEFLGNQKSGIYAQPQYPAPQQSEQTYPVVQENGETAKAVPVKLPPNWKTATDSEGNIYYYHIITRQSQWDPPSMEETSEADNGTPIYDEPKLCEHKHESHSRRSHKKHSKRKSTTTAPADTSSNPVNGEIAKKIKELFRTKMSTFVVQCLNPYRKDDCRVGRITSNEDFKHLARKLTHFVMAKELKHCKNVEDLDCNDNVKHKARDYIHKYMGKYGPLYRKEKSISFDE